MSVSRRAVALTALLPLTAAPLLAGCAHKHAHTAAAPSPSPSPSATPSPTPSATATPAAPATWALTGMPHPRRAPVVVVKVDNTANGRPPVGVEQADVVYVEQVEGGLTRMMAVFNSHLPGSVGPTRSARRNDLELLREYGRVALMFSGANDVVLASVRRAKVVDIDPDVAGGFYRSGSRPAPYNLFVDPRQAMRGHRGVTTGRDVGFRFATRLPGGHAVRGFTLRYPAASVGFSWDGSRRGWDEVIDGRAAHAADGKRLGGRNVIVQYVHVKADGSRDVVGNPTPFSVTVGSGRFQLFRDGHVYTGIWVRKKVDAPTLWLDASGKHRLTLARGNTWVLLAPVGTHAAIG